MKITQKNINILRNLCLTHHVSDTDRMDLCRDMKCAYGAQCVQSTDGLTAECQCTQTCDTTEATLCGTDGIDHVNLCHMKKTSCLEKKEINVKHQGKCS